jgi:formate C-acetyltransferase
MNNLSQLFYDIGEPYAAGLFEDTEASSFARFSRAQRRHWETAPIPPYDGGQLFPSGCLRYGSAALIPNYSFTYSYNSAEMERKSLKCTALLNETLPVLPCVRHPHDVGGNMYTHSIPNYGRIAREGLDSYARRAEKCTDPAFRDGISDLIEGIRNYHTRSLAMLREKNAGPDLIAALERVPFKPADNLYQAVVCFNFIYYMDGCDNPGMIDTDLNYFYRGEDITGLLRAYFINIDSNSGWTGALGPICNPLTIQCLHAVKGLRRPSLELRVNASTPDEVWEAAADSVLSGCGQPSFYNEDLYQSALSTAMPGVLKEDLLRFCGGGCTESMLSGISNVGSLDAGINVALIFCDYMNAHLAEAGSYGEFYRGLLDEIHCAVIDVLGDVDRARTARAAFRPHPVRTLFIDDCIDRGLDYNNGGARYSWSVINVAGLINVIDSLLAINNLIFIRHKYSAVEFLRLLNSGDALLFNEFKRCPCFGVDDPDADSTAHDFSDALFGFFHEIKPKYGEAFLPSSIQFVTYADAGKCVGATPDGRRHGEPLCDSIGAVHNRDTAGPTALLISAAHLAQPLAAGTPVMNIRINKSYVKKAIKPLITGYFEKDGMQLQVTCVSKQEIAEALADPEAHGNLVVRIGGYSEYFKNLSPELRQTVYERTEY